MQNKLIKLALIGCGRIAGHHFKSIKNYKMIKIIAVCDLKKKKAQEYSKKYKVPHFSNYHEMFKSFPSITHVSIMTPSGMHYENAIDIIKKYKKNIIVEKPTFLKPDQVKHAFKLAKKNKVKIYPVFQNRYNKAVKRLRGAINNKELGEIRLVGVRVRWCRPDRYYNLSAWRGTYSHDGGALTNQGIHHIDLLRYLFGEVIELNAQMKTLGANIEVEDSVVATMRLKKNIIGTLEVTTAARPHDYEASISVLGSKGMAQLGGWAVNELNEFSPKEGDCKKFSEKIPDAYGYGHKQFYKDLVIDVLGKKKFPIDEKDCFKTIKLLNAFYKSSEINKKVNVKKVGLSKKLGRKNEKISNLYRYEKN